MHKKPTYLNIGYVEKITYPTWKRALKSNANAKQNRIQAQSCGS
jgi:hypothetical protein